MTPIDIIGVALYSDDQAEIIRAIEEALERDNPAFIAAAARSIGHLARRFDVSDDRLTSDLHSRASSEFSDDDHVQGAVFDMEDDLQHLKPVSV